ncbi:MAG: DUF4783 domain-containing protein [Bacteroidales bacterium]|nr:DUF4783 domain-containing protein [Bacteroidales bacterium]
MKFTALFISALFFMFIGAKAFATCGSYDTFPADRPQQTQDVFVPLGKYIQFGDAESLSAWFASNLELDILGNTNECSKVQATQIMKNFFVTYTPKSFKIIHKSGKAPMKYAIGNLNAGGETFRVTLFVKTQANGNQIQQLRIERE